MELVQVATCTNPKFVHAATCTSHPVQVAILGLFLEQSFKKKYKLKEIEFLDSLENYNSKE